MPFASPELFDSDSEEPPKKRRCGELELLTSGDGYFSIPIVKIPANSYIGANGFPSCITKSHSFVTFNTKCPRA